MEIKKYIYLEEKYGCSISTKRTDVGIMEVDLYIATFSSTVLTATVYGIPSLVIDCFKANYKMFNPYKSIKIYDDIDLLGKKCKELIMNNDAYNELKQEARKDSSLLEKSPGDGFPNLMKLIKNEI